MFASRFITRAIIIASFGLGIAACATDPQMVHYKAGHNMETELTLLGSSSQIIVKNSDGTYCFGPMPDATIDEGSDVGLKSLSFFSAGAAEEEAPLGGRNPNVLITRDLLFQSCLAETRLKLNPKERKALFQRTLDLIGKINARSLDGAAVTNDNQADTVTLPSGSKIKGNSDSDNSDNVLSY